jgi:predicted signal transduction protein with EAL and GGDEF domain
MSENLEVDGHRIAVGVSVGVAIYPHDGTDAATLLSNADAALYRAKAEGRGTIRFFAVEMDQQLREKRSLQHDLRSALERNEFRLFYQPQATTGGEIIGFEALARWYHPNRGVVPPAEFIPIAEESSLIMSIGEWVLREACAEAASWPRPLQIAVNLSPAQFKQGDLPGLVLYPAADGPGAIAARTGDHRRRPDRRFQPCRLDLAQAQEPRRAHCDG